MPHVKTPSVYLAIEKEILGSKIFDGGVDVGPTSLFGYGGLVACLVRVECCFIAVSAVPSGRVVVELLRIVRPVVFAGQYPALAEKSVEQSLGWRVVGIEAGDVNGPGARGRACAGGTGNSDDLGRGSDATTRA